MGCYFTIIFCLGRSLFEIKYYIFVFIIYKNKII